jgi:hypothetical protein
MTTAYILVAMVITVCLFGAVLDLWDGSRDGDYWARHHRPARPFRRPARRRGLSPEDQATTAWVHDLTDPGIEAGEFGEAFWDAAPDAAAEAREVMPHVLPERSRRERLQPTLVTGSPAPDPPGPVTQGRAVLLARAATAFRAAAAGLPRVYGPDPQAVDWDRLSGLRGTGAHESGDLYHWYAQKEERHPGRPWGEGDPEHLRPGAGYWDDTGTFSAIVADGDQP